MKLGGQVGLGAGQVLTKRRSPGVTPRPEVGVAKPSKVPIWLIFQILAPGKGPDASRKVDDGKGGSWVSPEAASGARDPRGAWPKGGKGPIFLIFEVLRPCKGPDAM